MTLRRRAALALPLLGLARAVQAQTFDGALTQGGLVTGHVALGTRLTLDGRTVPVARDGRFALGFGRDSGDATLALRHPDGRTEQRRLTVKKRTYQEQRIDGLPAPMVTPDAAALERIKAEQVRIDRARAAGLAEALWDPPFLWPAEGIISGVYGSRRILNGQPRAPHLGLDIAGPVGTPIRAIGGGIVRLADADLYFTGGTVILDHGLGVTSFYAHLSRLDVREGARLAAGDHIGLMGATGRVTGPHLHLAANWFNVAIDPALMLPERK